MWKKKTIGSNGFEWVGIAMNIGVIGVCYKYGTLFRE
jgi:hypothetical protein